MLHCRPVILVVDLPCAILKSTVLAMNDILTWLGTSVGIIGVLYAFYESRQKRRLQDLIRANNWYMYQRMNNASRSVQLTMEKYKQAHAQSIDVGVLEWLSKSVAFTQEVFKEIIRQIQVFEPSFTEEDLDCWKNQGKLT